METLLTGAVNRLLRKYIKSAGGEAGSELRVSLSASGSVELYNLELDLQALMGRLPFAVRRAFANRLTVTVRWASLTIQVELDDVEILLAVDEADHSLHAQPSTLADELGAAISEEVEEAPAEGGSWWMDTFRPSLLQALANMTVVLRNVAVRCQAGGVTASLSCAMLHAASVADTKLSSRPEDEGWLTKAVELRGLCLDVLQHQRPGIEHSTPLLRTCRLQASATLPALVLLGEAASEASSPPSLDVAVDLLPLDMSLSDQQLQWMAAFAAAMPEAQPDDAVEEPAWPAQPEPATAADPGAATPQADTLDPQRPEGFQAFGWAAWQYLTDEEAPGAALSAQQPADLAVSLNLKLQGVQAKLLRSGTTGSISGTATTAQSPTVVAALQLIGVSAEAQLLASELQYAELRLHQLTVSRPRPAPLDPPWSQSHSPNSPRLISPPAAAAGGIPTRARSPNNSQRAAAAQSEASQEVFGLHPVRSGRQSAADMPLALWMQWQAGQPNDTAGTSATEPASASLRIGRLHAAHIPGFLAEVQQLLMLGPAADSKATAAEADGQASSGGNGEPQEPEAADAAPLLARWLAADLSVDLAISAVQLAALAAADVPAEAVLLDVAKISGQLGPIKARAHSVQHSMAAALLQQAKGGPPAHGFRLALSGLRLSTTSQWPLGGSAVAGSAVPAGGVDGSDSLATPASPACRQEQLPEAVSAAADLQLLMVTRSSTGGAGPPAGSARAAQQAAGDSWAAWAVLSPMSLRLTAPQLAAVSATLGSLSAGPDSVLRPTVPTAAAPQPSALDVLFIDMTTLQLAYSPLGSAAVSAGLAGSAIAAASSFAAATEALKASVSCSAAAGGGHMRLTCHAISAAAAPGFDLRVPVIEASFGQLPTTTTTSSSSSSSSSTTSSDAAAAQQQQRQDMPCRLTGFAISLDNSSRSTGGDSSVDLHVDASKTAASSSNGGPARRLAVRLNTFSAALEPHDWRSTLQFAFSLTAAPLLPPHSSYAVLEADHGSADSASEMDVRMDAVLVRVHVAGGQSLQRDSISVSLAGASYLQQQTAAGDSSASASVQYFDCCTHSSVAEPAFASFFRVHHPAGVQQGSQPLPMKLTSTSQGQAEAAASHTRLQLPVVELLLEPASVCCLMELLSQVPQRPPASPAPEQTAQAGRSAFQLCMEGLLVRLQHNSTEETAAADQVSCTLCTDAVDVVLNRPAASGRWGVEEGQYQEVDVKAAGLTVTISAADVPPLVSLLLAPQDWDVHLEHDAAAGTTAVLLRTSCLSVCASLAAAGAMLRLQAALTPPGSAEPDACAEGSNSGAAGAPTVHPQQHAQQTDDLTCGLFSLSPEVAGRPGVMQISLGDRAAGFMPWMGGGESWVCWRYSFARPVAALVLRGPAAKLPLADIELAHLDAASGEFVAVELQKAEPLGTPADALLLEVKKPVAASEWQLSCTAEGVHARDLLAHLRVNPQPHPLPQPARVPPLTVPLTLGLEAEAVNIAVLVPSAAAAPSWQEELGSIECGGLKAVAHMWQGGGWAMRLSCEAALRHHEHNAAVLRPLLHAPQLVLCLESGAQVHSCSSDQYRAEQSAVALATLQPGRSLLVPQPEPTAPGNHVLLRFLEGPVSVRLDELSVYSLQRLATILVAAKAMADDSTPGSDLAAEAMGDIVVENLCPDALRVQQVGSSSPVTVASHSTRQYQWELPPELADGAQRRIQLSGTAAPSSKLAWSHPIEVLSAGKSLQRVPMSDGSVRAVAVKVSRVGVGWRMTLRPAFGLRNLSGHELYLHFPGQHATDAGAPPPVLELQADEAAVVPVWLRDSAATQSSLLAWLGGGSGWSRPVSLKPAASGNEGIELAAGGFGDTSLPSMAHLAGRSVEVAATCSIHQQCGQIMITFSPLTRLHNSLPLAVGWRLLQQSPSDGAADPSIASGQLQPGASSPLPVRRGDARCLQLRCSPDAGGRVQAALDGAALTRGASLEARSGGSESMASGTSAAGVDDSGWSSPLAMGRRQASSGSWRLLAAAAAPTSATLPAPGDSCLVRVPWAPHTAASAAVLPMAGNGDGHGGGQPAQHWSVSLVAEEVLQGSPMLALTLLPYGVLHNCTGSDLVLEAAQGTGGWSAAAAAGTDAVIDAGDPAALPTEARLRLRLGSAVLQSWPFKLDHGCQHQLLLQHCKDGATTGYFVTLGVELRQRTSASKRAAAATPMLHVTCWDTFYVSNLTSQPVQLLPLHSLDPALGPIQCGVGNTVPVSLAWQAVTSKPAAAAPAAAASVKAVAATAASDAAGDAAATVPAEQRASAVTWPCTVAVQPVAPVLDDGGATGGAGGNGSTPSAAGSSATVSLAEPCRRRWLSMPGPGGRLRQVAYRLLRGRGRHHLVLFEEQQPPLRLVSAASMHHSMDFGLSPPQQQGLGRFTYGDEVSQALVLAPGQQHHCEMLVGDTGRIPHQRQQDQEHSSTEATIFEEDEAAFMERLAARSSAVMGPPPAVLRLRPHSGGDQGSSSEDQPWSPPCMLVPGRHAIGDWEVHICKQPGTLVARVQASCSSAQQSGDQLSALPAPLSFGVALQSFQLEVWDDERRHLSGGRLANGAGAEGSVETAAALCSKLTTPSQPVLTRQLGSRLFCISLDDLCLDLSRRHVNGSGGMGVQLRTHVNLTAGGLQVDSHLADAHYPVVWKWQPASARRQGCAATQPPFLFTLEVATALGESEARPQALSNTWVRRARLVLPPLALAVDDALLAFGDALQRTLQTADVATADRLDSNRQLINGMAAAEDQGVRAELQADALTCAATRLLVEELAIGAIQLTLDVHMSEASPQRIPVDAHAVPVALPPTAALRLWAWPATLVRGLAAHYLAEALLNAPQVLGGLDLFFNPTGLVRSITAGLADLFGLPMAALGRGSPAGFVAGLGTGSASLLRNLSGWTLTSIAGFSGAFSRLLERSLSASQAAGAAAGGGGPPGRPAQRRAPTTLAGGLSQGLAGLYGGVSSGVAGIVSAPVQGYTDGSGLVRGLGRGLVGAVGLPVSGALAAIEAVTSGIAAATGVSPMAIAQGAVPGPDSPHLAARPSLCRLATHAAEARRLLTQAAHLPHSGTAEASTSPVGVGSWGLHGLLACRPSAAEAAVLAVPDPETAEAVQLAAPVAMIVGELLAVCGAGGSTLRLCLGLQGAQLQLDADARQIMVRSRAWKLVGRTGGDSAGDGDLRVMLRLADADFHPWACMLRRAMA